MRYTFDDDAEDSDDFSIRRSTRNSDRSTPADVSAPVVTASGRQVRQRGGGLYGESLLSGQVAQDDTPTAHDLDMSEASDGPRNMRDRAARSGGRIAQLNGSRKRKYIDGYNEVDQMSDEDDATSSANEWDGGDDDDVDDNILDDEPDDESDLGDDEDEDDLAEPQSLVVKLKVRQHPKLESNLEPATKASSEQGASGLQVPPDIKADEKVTSQRDTPEVKAQASESEEHVLGSNTGDLAQSLQPIANAEDQVTLPEPSPPVTYAQPRHPLAHSHAHPSPERPMKLHPSTMVVSPPKPHIEKHDNLNGIVNQPPAPSAQTNGWQ